ncbi:gap junction delta-2 protein-like [Styela clava]
MAWHLLEKMIEHSAAHSTLLGKWWISFMFVFRIIVVASIGDTVYSDEQDEFTCNTKQPGCKQVCYNMFAPISHIRFWAFQILATGTPSVIFIIFAMHKLAQVPKAPEGDDKHKETGSQTAWRYAIKKKEKEREKSKDDKKSSEKKKKENIYVDTNGVPKKGSVRSSEIALLHSREVWHDNTSSIFPEEVEKISRETKMRRTKRMVVRTYLCNVIFRTIIEGGCLFLQYYLYQWSVPEFYECIRYPCPKIVECYISRPMEKTIFLHFMFAVAVVCIFLNILELKFLGYKKIKRVFTPVHEKFIPPSVIEGTYPVHSHNGINHRGLHNRERVIERNPKHAPPGYYIPDVNPPVERYRSPASGFPPIRVGAASFNTSETGLTSDTDSMSSDPSLYRHAH